MPFSRRSLILLSTSQQEGRGARHCSTRLRLSKVWRLVAHKAAPASSAATPCLVLNRSSGCEASSLKNAHLKNLELEERTASAPASATSWSRLPNTLTRLHRPHGAGLRRP
eukprot:scaffold78357_cov111-Phaeocystis_antarctica.AAC.1